MNMNRLNQAWVIYEHENIIPGVITTTVFDTDLSFAASLPHPKALSLFCFPYKTDGVITMIMLARRDGLDRVKILK